MKIINNSKYKNIKNGSFFFAADDDIDIKSFSYMMIKFLLPP